MELNDRISPFLLAKELFQSRYSGAEVLFVAGSFLRDEATASSDVDLVVVYPKLKHAYRESFFYKGWPVEAFVHDPETLNYFFSELDAKDGMPALPNMVVEGRPFPESHPLVCQLKSLADRVLTQGPPIFQQDQLQNFKYGINDLLEDLKSPRNSFEEKSIIAKIHESLGDFWFRSRGKWSASGKHISRRMRKLDPQFADQWTSAFEMAFAGQTQGLIRLIEAELAQKGDFSFDGYRREAPEAFRKPLPAAKNIQLDYKIEIQESGLNKADQIVDHGKLGKIQVRLVTLADVPMLRILLNSAYQRLADMNLNFNATFQDDELTADGILDGRTFVLDFNGKLLGTMKLRHQNVLDDRPCLYVGRFAVDPQLQGQGLGLHLLYLAEKLARQEGCQCLQLDTAQPAEHLLKFYQGQGFQIKKPTYFEGKTYVSWVLEKSLK